ncbi:hypothetical protein A946_11655 [Methylacidiphilum kamchatkense Kam1]|uniref:Tetratricopeptide repeat protein n=1 Tax=Methylacidiphilum kamchatkense Kam1 TaxID=1202785 RepID=A0A0C1RS29_9BACT|nr:tetratricopeptide repeat protein [Methylacidiphilum kamchatkense]KIE57726.1 hypothetical protein A946_11655 [Methylacidiphilum kamchatkense Kam1]QDQ41511.1 tetratricopeptide repeat protein [Methylacidiphilum kamchatkense Kam1]
MKPITVLPLSFFLPLFLFSSLALSQNPKTSQVTKASQSKAAALSSPSSSKEDLSKLLINRSKLLIEEKKYKDVFPLLRKAQSLDSKNGQIYRLFGQCYTLQRNRRKALLAYKKAVAVDPTDPENWMALGLEEEHLSKHKEALEAFKEALLLKPTAQGWLHLGVAYMNLGRFNEALYPLQKAASLDHGLIEAWHNLGLCYEKLGKKEAAHTAFSKAYLLNPTNTILQQNLSRITAKASVNQKKP